MNNLYRVLVYCFVYSMLAGMIALALLLVIGFGLVILSVIAYIAFLLGAHPVSLLLFS